MEKEDLILLPRKKYDYTPDPMYKEQPKTCRYCGKEDLYWQAILDTTNIPMGYNYRLADENGIHRCF